MIGIEIFAGAGGMATGAALAGIDIRIAVENDPYAAQTYMLNHKNTTMVIDDIQNVKHFEIDKSSSEVILFGGPPCQGYSYSNRKTRTKQNPKNWLFKEFIKVVQIIKPEWLVIENVPGLKKMDNGFFLKEICDDLHRLDYTPSVKIVNAKDFGVPQNRERLFIVASSKGLVFDFPVGGYKQNPITVGDAINDLPVLKNGSLEHSLSYKFASNSEYSKMLKGRKKKVTQNYVTKNSDRVINRYQYVKQGNNWKDIPDELMSNYKDHTRCHGNIYRRLNESEPAVIISNYRKSMLIHPTENRGLSVREAARLQSFPDSYEFIGSLDQIQQQVGNAVPPLLAKAIFEKIKDYTL